MKKIKFLLFLLTTPIFLCHSQTSSSISNKDLTIFFNNYFKQQRSYLKLVGVAKTNGIKKEFYGQQIYAIEYDLVLENTNTIYINPSEFSTAWGANFTKDFSYAKTGSNQYEAAISGAKKQVLKGKRFYAKGTLNFEQTDNGWRAKGFSNKSCKEVDKKYLPPGIVDIIAQENKIRIEKIKKGLDWTREDVAKNPDKIKFFRSEDLPIFNEGVSKYTFKKSKLYVGRNDVFNQIQNSFFNTVKATNRFTEIGEEKYKASSIRTRINFSLNKVNFVFKETGYHCNIILNSFIYYNMSGSKSYVDKKTFTIQVSNKSFQKNLSKQRALDAAIGVLGSELKKFILQQESIKLEVLKLTLDKKGNVSEVVFRRPDVFIKTSKIDFMIFEESKLDIINNKVVTGGVIARCLMKGERSDTEISCRVKGKKNKKALKGIDISNGGYIGVSTIKSIAKKIK